MSVGTWIQITFLHMRLLLCQTKNFPGKKKSFSKSIAEKIEKHISIRPLFS